MILTEITKPIKSNFLSDEAKQFVSRHCQPYLNAVDYDLDKYAMFRGVSRQALGRMEETHIESLYMSPGCYAYRKPKDTPESFHNTVNKMFVKKFGIPFRNGVFATGATRNAKYYGHVTQIIPVGDFRFCWSPQVQDFYSLTEDNATEQEAVGEARRLITTDYSDKNLKQAILSHHEIMLYCEKVLINFTSGIGSHFVVREGGYHIGNGDVSISVAGDDTYKIMSPEEADIYCNKLVHARYSDWILPTLQDMKMITTAMRNIPGYTIDTSSNFICKGRNAESHDTKYYSLIRGGSDIANSTEKYVVIPIRRTMV
jgi:hypothetical protein